MEPIEPFGNITCLQSSEQPYVVNKEGHFLAGAGTSGYFEDLEKREIHPNIQVFQAKSDGKYLVWLWPQEAIKRSTQRFLIKSSRKKKTKQNKQTGESKMAEE